MSTPEARLDVPWSTAPAANIVDTAKPLTWRRFRQHGLWPYLPPLVFLGFNLFPLWGLPTGQFLLGLGYAALIGAAYVGTNPMLDAPLWARIGYALGFLLVVFSGWPLIGAATVQNALFANVMFALLLPARISIPLGIAWSGSITVFGGILNDGIILVFGATGLAVTLAVTVALQLSRSEWLLAQTRIELEQAILTAERERIARDVHDVLGHSLTALAVKADLVERLIPRDPEQALMQVRDVQAIARQSLADMRATTTGLREVSLASEIASARAVLDAARIDAVAPTAVDPLDAARNTVFGYVVREAVTNVARHSGARWCHIDIGPTQVTVTDDGSGIVPGRRSGSGLRGLRERLAEVGGTLTVSTREGGGTVVRAEVPVPA